MAVGDSDSPQSDSSGSLVEDAPPSYTDLTHPLQQSVSSERAEVDFGDEVSQGDTELVQIPYPPPTVIENPVASAPPLPVERQQPVDMGVVMPLPQQAESAEQVLPGGQPVPLRGGRLHPVFYQPTSGKLFMSADGSYHALPWQFGVDGVQGRAPPGPTAPGAGPMAPAHGPMGPGPMAPGPMAAGPTAPVTRACL